MDMQTAYAIQYLEINIVSVLLVLIIRYKTGGLSRMVAQRNFAMAIDSEVLFFLTDTFYVMMKCGMFPWNKAAAMAAKELYFFATTLMCFFWFVYFEYIQDSPFVKSRKRIFIASSLVFVMAGLLLVNLFTGILFYVNEEGAYCRGPLFVVQYLLSYIYVFIACSRAFLEIFKERNYARRKLLIALALFPVAPAGAGILQFIYPELPMACAALSLATLVMYLNWIDEMISIDPLTHLNNRKQLVYYYEQWIHNLDGETQLYLLLVDANKFKGINDTYGHIQGDAALVRIADALRLGCRDLKRRANIARYGGDEFVLLVWAEGLADIEDLKKRIQQTLRELNQKAQAPYELTVSIGVAAAKTDTSLKDLLAQADEQMYEEKRKR